MRPFFHSMIMGAKRRDEGPKLVASVRLLTSGTL